MEKVRDDFEHIKAALDEMLYYNPEELERQADEYERARARKEGREEGRKEGREEGFKQGREELTKEIIENLIKKNYPMDKISEILNLEIDFLNVLLNKE